MKKELGARTIAAPLPAWVIGTWSPAGRANAMTAAWTGVCNSEPPCVYFSVRESRYTWDCVQASRAFSVNIPGRGQAALVDYLGIKSGRNVDKVAQAGLTPVDSGKVAAPYFAEFPLVLCCGVIKTVELGTHFMVVGEIRQVLAEEELLDDRDKLDIARLGPVSYCPPDGQYYTLGDCLGAGYSLGKDIGG